MQGQLAFGCRIGLPVRPPRRRRRAARRWLDIGDLPDGGDARVALAVALMQRYDRWGEAKHALGLRHAHLPEAVQRVDQEDARAMRPELRERLDGNLSALRLD